MHEHLCLLETQNYCFGTCDLLQVQLQVFDHQFQVADLTHDLPFVLDGFFECFDMGDVLVRFVEIGLDEFDNVFTVHFRA